MYMPVPTAYDNRLHYKEYYALFPALRNAVQILDKNNMLYSQEGEGGYIIINNSAPLNDGYANYYNEFPAEISVEYGYENGSTTKLMGVDGAFSYGMGTGGQEAQHYFSGVISVSIDKYWGLYFKSPIIKEARDEFNLVVKFKYTASDGAEYYYYIGYHALSQNYSDSDPPCVTEDTLITLADGTQKRVDQLTGKEQLLVWNLETGKLDSAPIMFIDSEERTINEVIHLYFSDGTEVKVMAEHGFWDYDLNKYLYLDKNASMYIGHTFAKQDGDKLTKVKLVGVDIKSEMSKAYSPVTVGHLCYFVNGMLSMPGGVGGLFNIFDVDPTTMTYDYEAMQRDIEKYGLFTYEEMNAIVPLSEEMFIAAGGKYLKISIGKGNMTIDDLIYMVNRYKEFI